MHWQSQQTEGLSLVWKIYYRPLLTFKKQKQKQQQNSCWAKTNASDRPGSRGEGAVRLGVFKVLWCPNAPWHHRHVKMHFCIFFKGCRKSCCQSCRRSVHSCRRLDLRLVLQTGSGSKVHARVISSGTDWETATARWGSSADMQHLMRASAADRMCTRGGVRGAWLGKEGSIYN